MGPDGARRRVVVLGGGIGGLAAAYYLAREGSFDVTVIEREAEVGGLCRSFRHDGFVLDHGPHKIHSILPGILDDIRAVMGDRLLTLEKRLRIVLGGRRLDYPVRLANLVAVLGPGTAMSLGLGYVRALVARGEPDGYAGFVRARFGAAAYELVFRPLADKIWGDAATLHADMARARLPTAGPLVTLLRLLGLAREDAAANAATFLYPKGGFGEFPATLARRIEEAGGRIVTGAEVVGVRLAGDRVEAVRWRTADGAEAEAPCDLVVPSIPLALTARLLFGDGDAEFAGALARLGHRNLMLVYLFVARDRVLDDQWLYFPEPAFLFSRLFEQKRLSADFAPPGRTALCCDLACADGDWAWRAPEAEVAARCAADLARAGFLKAGEVTGHLVRRARAFYPRYGLDYAAGMAVVTERLGRLANVIPTGRIGLYSYNNSDHCMDMGRFIAERLAAGDAPPAVLAGLARRVRDYRIVD